METRLSEGVREKVGGAWGGWVGGKGAIGKRKIATERVRENVKSERSPRGQR